jgi:hypothetical protein
MISGSYMLGIIGAVEMAFTHAMMTCTLNERSLHHDSE